jgi:Cu/Ag efflux protein CusF
VAVGLSAALTSQAQPTLTQVPTAALATPAEMTDGEVRKVDKEAGKLTLRHAPLVHLDMPAMTMVFRVADPKMFEQVKPGDKVRFKADKISGQFTVTRIEVATP